MFLSVRLTLRVMGLPFARQRYISLLKKGNLMAEGLVARGILAAKKIDKRKSAIPTYHSLYCNWCNR